MLHRIRKAMDDSSQLFLFTGPVEMDKMYVGRQARNQHALERSRQGRVPVGKTPATGVDARATNRCSAQVVRKADSETTLALPDKHLSADAVILTDGDTIYSMPG